MENPHLTPAGARLAQCSDEAACTVVSCAVCLKEIPADSIRVTDAQEYVHHFCGLDCLEIWRKQATADAGESGSPRSDRLK
jgi:hypothetical protein